MRHDLHTSRSGPTRSGDERSRLTAVAVIVVLLVVAASLATVIVTSASGPATAATAPSFSLPASQVVYVGRSVSVPIVVTGGDGSYRFRGSNSNRAAVGMTLQGGRDAHHGSLRIRGLAPGTSTFHLTFTSAGRSTTHSMKVVTKPGVKPPSVVQASFGTKILALTWNTVGATSGYSAAASYYVTVRATGVAGPVIPVKVTVPTYNVAYSHILGSAGKSASGYTVQVASVTKGGLVSNTTTQKVGARHAGAAVSTSSISKAVSKAKACLKQGTAAGVTAGAGGGVVFLATFWIPGVDVITAGGVAQAAATTTLATSVVCLVK